MEELYKIIKGELTKKFGSEERADEVLGRVGELVIVDLVDEVIHQVKDKKLDIENELEASLEEGNLPKFLEISKNAGIAVEYIFDRVAKNIINDVFKDVN